MSLLHFLDPIRAVASFAFHQYEREPQLALTIFCLLVIIAYLFYLLTTQKYRPKEAKLTRAEEDKLIAEWTPVPLAPALSERMRKRRTPVVESACDTHVVIAGNRVLNLSAMNFLGIANDKEMKEACQGTVDKYGVGSCGPRGFYGSIDTHLDLEKEIAQFYGTKDAILYSDGFQTIASAIPAFAKKGDILICDEAVNFSIQSGCSLSRAIIHNFKHNDMEDLERILMQIQKQDERKKVKEIKNRRFIVIEGIYQNFGDLAPLKKIVELRHKYRYRLILDDTLAVGVLGKTGKGSWEHCGVPVEEIEILCAGLDATVGSVGGYCVGSTAVVDHQRLSGAGYCFSASAPPFTSTASIHGLRTITKRPDLIDALHRNSARFRNALQNIAGIEVKGESISPLIHIHLAREKSRGYERDLDLLEDVAEELMGQGVAVQVSQYLASEKRPPNPSLKVYLSAAHTEKDLDSAVALLRAAFGRALRE